MTFETNIDGTDPEEHDFDSWLDTKGNRAYVCNDCGTMWKQDPETEPECPVCGAGRS